MVINGGTLINNGFSNPLRFTQPDTGQSDRSAQSGFLNNMGLHAWLMYSDD